MAARYGSARYYLDELERLTGQSWGTAPKTLASAMGRVAVGRRIVTALNASYRVLTLVLYLSIVAVLGGVSGGVFRLFHSGTPTTLLVVFGIIAGGLAGGLRFHLAVGIRPQYEGLLVDAEARYQELLEKSIS
jgi:hypothetical protein